MEGAFVVILSPSRGNFLGSRDFDPTEKRHPCKWMPFLLERLMLLCYFVNVIVQAEDGACQEECLPDVEQKSVCHIRYGKHLIGYHYHTCANQHNGTRILNLLFSVHTLE